MKVFKGIKSCLGSIVSALILVLVAYGGWRWGDVVFPWLEREVEERGIDLGRGSDEGEPASEEMAADAVARLEALRGSGGGEASFSGAELTSMLRFTYADELPAAVHGLESA